LQNRLFLINIQQIIQAGKLVLYFRLVCFFNQSTGN